MGGAGLLVDPRDGAAWAAAVTSIATDPEAREAHLQAGRQRAAGFTWSANAERLRVIHSDLMGRQSEESEEKENLTR
jgi:glycosyltransferase involved in cell wall biosynthesis